MIQGLTTNRTPRPAVLGTLRKGSPKQKRTKNGKEIEIVGKDLDHFRLDAEPDLVAALEAEYGPEPNNIVVYLPFQAADENFEAWMEEWNASELIHRCDGVHVYERDALGDLVNTGRACPYASGAKERTTKQPGCKQVGRLSVIIPALITRAQRFGLVTVLTTSIYDIAAISQALSYFEMMSGGDLRGIPFILGRKPRMVSSPVNGRKARVEKWLIQIEPAQEWVARRLEASRRAALAVPAIAALPAPEGDEDEDEAARALANDNVVDLGTGEIMDDDDDERLATAWQQWQKAVASAAKNGVAVTNEPDGDASFEAVRDATKALNSRVAWYRRVCQLEDYAKELGIESDAGATNEAELDVIKEACEALAEDIRGAVCEMYEQAGNPEIELPPDDAKIELWVEVARALAEQIEAVKPEPELRPTGRDLDDIIPF